MLSLKGVANFNSKITPTNAEIIELKIIIEI